MYRSYAHSLVLLPTSPSAGRADDDIPGRGSAGIVGVDLRMPALAASAIRPLSAAAARPTGALELRAVMRSSAARVPEPQPGGSGCGLKPALMPVLIFMASSFLTLHEAMHMPPSRSCQDQETAAQRWGIAGRGRFRVAPGVWHTAWCLLATPPIEFHPARVAGNLPLQRRQGNRRRHDPAARCRRRWELSRSAVAAERRAR